jgi:hypothetical protein
MVPIVASQQIDSRPSPPDKPNHAAAPEFHQIQRTGVWFISQTLRPVHQHHVVLKQVRFHLRIASEAENRRVCQPAFDVVGKGIAAVIAFMRIGISRSHRILDHGDFGAGFGRPGTPEIGKAQADFLQNTVGKFRSQYPDSFQYVVEMRLGNPDDSRQPALCNLAVPDAVAKQVN